MENRNDLYLKILYGSFIVSLFLPGLYEYGDVIWGIQILLIGWLGITVPSWYANPFLLFALKSIKNRKFTNATTYSLIATVLGFYALYTQLLGNKCIKYLGVRDYEYTSGCISMSMIDSTANYTLSIGYYLWLIVIVYTLILSVVNLIKNNAANQTI